MNTTLKERIAHAILEHQFSQRPGKPKKGSRASKRTRGVASHGKKRRVNPADLDQHKKDEHLGKHDKDSFHAIMDPDNDQYLERKGTKDE